MEIKQLLDVDGNGKVNARDAQKLLDDSTASGATKFIWGTIFGMAVVIVPMVLWGFIKGLFA